MSHDTHIHFISPAERLRIIERLEATGGGHLVPIFEATASGVCILIQQPEKREFHLPKARPSIVVIGDDLDTSRGPEAFHLRSVRRALAKAHSCYLMIGGPLPRAYVAAAVTAEAGLNVVIIESQPAEEASWLEFVNKHRRPGGTVIFATPKAQSITVPNTNHGSKGPTSETRH